MSELQILALFICTPIVAICIVIFWHSSRQVMKLPPILHSVKFNGVDCVAFTQGGKTDFCYNGVWYQEDKN